ncbi:hypothetical protein J2Z52_002772 [Enterococcus rivorum]|nr:hypothetical protein [Enterococcus rivorum]
MIKLVIAEDQGLLSSALATILNLEADLEEWALLQTVRKLCN